VRGEAGNIPSILLAVKSGAGLAPPPAPLGDSDDELLCHASRCASSRAQKIERDILLLGNGSAIGSAGFEGLWR
jgi:hypothetical protein